MGFVKEHHHSFVFVIGWWLGQAIDDSDCSFLVQITDDTVVLGGVDTYLTDMKLGFGLLKPYLRLRSSEGGQFECNSIMLFDLLFSMYDRIQKRPFWISGVTTVAVVLYKLIGR